MNNTDSSTLNKSDAALLQPYLDAATTCQNTATMRAVVAKVLQETELFAGYDQIKAALLQTTNNVDEKILHTLDLFSYGTLADYQLNKLQSEQYLPLTEGQLLKLRQLTVLSLIETACQQRENIVPYQAIQQAIFLNNNNDTTSATGGDRSAHEQQQQQLRETEHILSQLLAARVVTGKLSQKKSALLLKSSSTTSGNGILVRPRDVHPSTVANMLQALQQIRSKLTESDDCIRQQQTNVLKALENEKAAIQEAESKWKDTTNSSSYSVAAAMMHGVAVGEQPMLEDFQHHTTGAAAAARTSFSFPRRQKRSRGGFTNTSSGVPEQGNPSAAAAASRPFGL